MSKKRSSAIMVFAVTGVCASLLWSAGCSRRSAASRTPRNLLLITVDGLSPERVGCYAHMKRSPTPVLDGLALAGVLMEDARAASMVSLPAHVSLLSGLTPDRHGSRSNTDTVGTSVQTLALALRAQGYRTAAVVGDPALGEQTGLNRGFEIFDAKMPLSPRQDGLLLGPDPQYRPVRSAATVTKAAGDLLVSALSSAKQAKGKAPSAWFLWVNYADALPPYRVANKKLREYFSDPRDASVAQIDEEIGKLFQLLQMAAAKENTLVVVAGGTPPPSFASDGAAFRVPWLLTRKGELVSGKRVKTTVSLTSLPATVASLLGVTLEGAWTPSQDLSQALLAEGEPAAVSVSGDNPLPKLVFGTEAAPAAADVQAYELVRNALLDGSGALSNTVAEAGAKLLAAYPDSVLLQGWSGVVALSQSNPAAAEAAFRKADQQTPGTVEWRNNLAVTLCVRGRVPEGLDMLDKLYEAQAQAPDVRNNFLRLLSFAGDKLLSVKEAESGLTCYQRMVQIAPESAPAYAGCGRAFVMLGRREQAIEAYRKSLKLNPRQLTVREALKALGVTLPPAEQKPKQKAAQPHAP